MASKLGLNLVFLKQFEVPQGPAAKRVYSLAAAAQRKLVLGLELFEALQL